MGHVDGAGFLHAGDGGKRPDGSAIRRSGPAPGPTWSATRAGRAESRPGLSHVVPRVRPRLRPAARGHARHVDAPSPRAIDQRHGAPYPGVAVPYRFAASLEATEDHRFVSEPGIDPFAVARVFYSYLSGRGDQGGATLYQQLAKMLYTPGRTGVAAETEQVALAVKLKYGYDGAEILRLYADVAYFGHGFYGLEEASCGYFGARPDQLSWPQAALLASLVQAPTTDDPIDHPAAGLAREQHVIGRLVAGRCDSQADANTYLAVPPQQLAEPRSGVCHGCCRSGCLGRRWPACGARPRSGARPGLMRAGAVWLTGPGVPRDGSPARRRPWPPCPPRSPPAARTAPGPSGPWRPRPTCGKTRTGTGSQARCRRPERRCTRPCSCPGPRRQSAQYTRSRSAGRSR